MKLSNNNNSNNNFNIENLDYLKNYSVENQNEKNKIKIISRAHSQLNKGILSPRDKNSAISDLIISNNASEKNSIKEKKINKYYKINYNFNYNNSNTTKNILEANKKRENSNEEICSKRKNSNNKISINYLKKPNLYINTNNNIINLDKKSKNKSNNYLNQISKALQMRQSPKEIDKKNIQYDYFVSRINHMNDFHLKLEKNHFNGQKNILSNNLEFPSNYNEKFYNEIKTASTLENLNSDDDDYENQENMDPLELKSDKDYNENELDFDNNYKNLDHQIDARNRNTNSQNKENKNCVDKFNYNLNYLKNEEDKKINSNIENNCAILKCLEITLNSYDHLNLDNEEILNLNTEEKITSEDITSDNKGKEIVESLNNSNKFLKEVNSVSNSNSNKISNNYNRRINNSILKNNHMINSGNKFYEKFILEKSEYNQNESTFEKNNIRTDLGRNNNEININDKENIYKRKKIYNSNNVPINNILITDTDNNSNRQIYNHKDHLNNQIISKKNGDSISFIYNSEKIKNEINVNIEDNFQTNGKTNRKSNLRLSEKEDNDFNSSIRNKNDNNKYFSENGNETIVELKKNISPSGTNPTSINNKEYNISFEKNSNNINSYSSKPNNKINPFKIRNKVVTKIIEDQNNIESPEELHIYYVKTLQKGKNFIVNFD